MKDPQELLNRAAWIAKRVDGKLPAYFGWLPQGDVFFYVVGNNGEANVKPVVATVLHAALAIAGITPDRLQKPVATK